MNIKLKKMKAVETKKMNEEEKILKAKSDLLLKQVNDCRWEINYHENKLEATKYLLSVLEKEIVVLSKEMGDE